MKKFSALKITAISAVSALLVAMVLEIVFVRALDMQYESLSFAPVRLLTLISVNLVGGCIFTKIIDSSLIKGMDDTLRAKFKKARTPALAITAVLVIADCVKDAFLHPEATTVSAALTAGFLIIGGIAAVITAKSERVSDKLGYIVGAVMVFIIAFILTVHFALCFTIDMIDMATFS